MQGPLLSNILNSITCPKLVVEGGATRGTNAVVYCQLTVNQGCRQVSTVSLSRTKFSQNRKIIIFQMIPIIYFYHLLLFEVLTEIPVAKMKQKHNSLLNCFVNKEAKYNGTSIKILNFMFIVSMCNKQK